MREEGRKEGMTRPFIEGAPHLVQIEIVSSLKSYRLVWSIVTWRGTIQTKSRSKMRVRFKNITGINEPT